MASASSRRVLGGVLALWFSHVAPVARADAPPDDETKVRLARFERGPAVIDIARYPRAAQDSYQLFTTICAECHKLMSWRSNCQ